MLPSAHICWTWLCGPSPGQEVTVHRDIGARRGQGPAGTEGCPSTAHSSGRSSWRNAGELGTSPGRGMEQHCWKITPTGAAPLPGRLHSSSR